MSNTYLESVCVKYIYRACFAVWAELIYADSEFNPNDLLCSAIRVSAAAMHVWTLSGPAYHIKQDDSDDTVARSLFWEAVQLWRVDLRSLLVETACAVLTSVYWVLNLFISLL